MLNSNYKILLIYLCMGVVYILCYVWFVRTRVCAPMRVHAESRGIYNVRQVINDKNGPCTWECQFPEHDSAQSP